MLIGILNTNVQEPPGSSSWFPANTNGIACKCSQSHCNLGLAWNMNQFSKLSFGHRALADNKGYPDARSLSLTPVRANQMPLLNHRDRRRVRRFHTLLSKTRVKIEHEFKEMKTYKAIGRFGGTHAGSCLFAWTRGLSFRKLRPYVSKKNCLLFNENFPADKPQYRLPESILATSFSRHKLFIYRTPESFRFPCRARSLLFCHTRELAFEFCLPTCVQRPDGHTFLQCKLWHFQMYISYLLLGLFTPNLGSL